jgi:hypothetical protein
MVWTNTQKKGIIKISSVANKKVIKYSIQKQIDRGKGARWISFYSKLARGAHKAARERGKIIIMDTITKAGRETDRAA